MAGLREQQKERRRSEILDAALHLFEQNGFSGTPVERIAARVGVSEPTVFKYFPAKQDILLGLLDRADRHALVDARREMPLFDNAIDAICHLSNHVVDHELKILSPSIWRELVTMGIMTDAPKIVSDISDYLLEETSLLLQDLQSRKLIGRDVDINYMSFLLNDYSTILFMRLVFSEKLDVPGHKLAIRRFVTSLFTGMA